MWGLGICKHGKCFPPLDHLPSHLGVDFLFVLLFCFLETWSYCEALADLELDT